MMSNHTFFIRVAVCLLGLLVLFSGCQDKAAEPEKKSQVVSQKISADPVWGNSDGALAGAATGEGACA